MKKPSSFEKRVKRRIIGREHVFFAACSPGLKKVCHAEILASGFSEDSLDIIEGGIEFKGKPDTCMAFNLYLRSPLKILMRISRFKADSFEKLEKKIAAIDWNLYLPKNCTLNFNVTARKSRLYHSDAIAQRCKKSITEQLSSNETFIAANKSIQTVYVRADQDEFTISLDTSGELLFKRGIKKKVTQAPLRETIAFAMLSWAGFSHEDILVDPMCGSGTFSLEAAMMKTKVPPGFVRSFAFENWPGFSDKAYAHLKKQAEKQFVSFSEKQIFASDMDDMALSALEQNISVHAFNRIIDVCKKDFFSIHPSMIHPGKKGVVMLNPPYGKRLGEKTDTQSFYNEIEKKLKADFKSWRLGIVLPSREDNFLPGLTLQLKPIFNGGLDIFAGIGII